MARRVCKCAKYALSPLVWIDTKLASSNEISDSKACRLRLSLSNRCATLMRLVWLGWAYANVSACALCRNSHKAMQAKNCMMTKLLRRKYNATIPPVKNNNIVSIANFDNPPNIGNGSTMLYVSSVVKPDTNSSVFDSRNVWIIFIRTKVRIK